MAPGGDGSLSSVPTQGPAGDASRTEQPRGERPPRNGERGGRGRGGAERTEGGERPPRPERNQDRIDTGTDGRSDRSAELREPREPREPRGEGRGERRPDRRPRQDQGEAVATASADGDVTHTLATADAGAASAMADTTEGAEGRDDRPRERQGRERRPRADRPRRDGDGDRQPVADTSPQQALEGFTAPVAVAVEAAPTAAVLPVQALSAQRPPTPKSQAAPVATGLPKVAPYALPLQDLAQIAEACGLQWVNSDAEKIRLAQEAIAAQPAPVHLPRERPAPVVIDEGPLVLVETRRDLRTMTLPFEKAATA